MFAGICAEMCCLESPGRGVRGRACVDVHARARVRACVRARETRTRVCGREGGRVHVRARVPTKMPMVYSQVHSHKQAGEQVRRYTCMHEYMRTRMRAL